MKPLAHSVTNIVLLYLFAAIEGVAFKGLLRLAALETGKAKDVAHRSRANLSVHRLLPHFSSPAQLFQSLLPLQHQLAAHAFYLELTARPSLCACKGWAITWYLGKLPPSHSSTNIPLQPDERIHLRLVFKTYPMVTHIILPFCSLILLGATIFNFEKHCTFRSIANSMFSSHIVSLKLDLSSQPYLAMSVIAYHLSIALYMKHSLYQLFSIVA